MNASLSSTVVGEVLQVEGPLNFESMPRILEETALYAAQDNLPSCLAIDLANVTDIDSSAVALLLHWRRAADRLKKSLRYVHLPQNLVALAQLYGVDELIHCPAQQTNPAS